VGRGSDNLEYAPLAEITGRSYDLAPEACNCAGFVSGPVIYAVGGPMD
jgi:hypothetical protein